MTALIEACPYCGDSHRLSFNRGPVWAHGLIAYDEGDLFSCASCGGHGESSELVEVEQEEDSSTPDLHTAPGRSTV
jgi:hypothetical protein